jgi:hypothetical protein
LSSLCEGNADRCFENVVVNFDASREYYFRINQKPFLAGKIYRWRFIIESSIPDTYLFCKSKGLA